MKKLVIISDTHTKEKNVILPKGDILIHAGDFDIRDPIDLDYIIKWFQSLDFKHIVWIGGNHDFYLEELFKQGISPYQRIPKNIHYLCNSSVEIEGIKIWGSPFSPFFHDWAFMGFLEDLKKIWNTIPEDTDIVITHAPPFGINDHVQPGNRSQGCPALRDKIKEIKPKYHICGHIHEGYGIYQDEHTVYINASLMDEFYNLCNKPMEIEYERKNNR